jgi:hypothetical protein
VTWASTKRRRTKRGSTPPRTSTCSMRTKGRRRILGAAPEPGTSSVCRPTRSSPAHLPERDQRPARHAKAQTVLWPGAASPIASSEQRGRRGAVGRRAACSAGPRPSDVGSPKALALLAPRPRATRQRGPLGQMLHGRVARLGQAGLRLEARRSRAERGGPPHQGQHSSLRPDSLRPDGSIPGQNVPSSPHSGRRRSPRPSGPPPSRGSAGG